MYFHKSKDQNILFSFHNFNADLKFVLHAMKTSTYISIQIYFKESFSTWVCVYSKYSRELMLIYGTVILFPFPIHVFKLVIGKTYLAQIISRELWHKFKRVFLHLSNNSWNYVHYIYFMLFVSLQMAWKQ